MNAEGGRRKAEGGRRKAEGGTDALDLRIKRAYDAPAPDDGVRVLVDALWPRGVSRAQLALDDWARDLAPSAELRRWFAHDPSRFQAFRARYRSELVSRELPLERLRRRAAAGTLTLVYAARDQQHNNAQVLAEVLKEMPAPPEQRP